MTRSRTFASALSLVLLPLVAATLGCSSSDGGGTGGAGGGSGGRGGAGGTGGGTGGTGGGTGGTGGGGTGGSGTGAALTTYKVCERSQKQGDFVISLTEAPSGNFSAVDGRLMSAVELGGQAKLVKQVGGCRILQPPDAFMCSTPCDSTQECAPTGCRPRSRAMDLGTVTVTGMHTSPMTLVHPTNPDLFTYNNPGTLPFPAFDEGANLTLQATGVGGWGPFTLKGWGVAPLVVPTAPVTVQMGQPVTLTWTPPAKPGPGKMFIDFSINRHGSVDAWLECTVDDNGSFTVTGEMTTELFKNGVSGFPSVSFTRQSGDTTMVMGGCVQLLVSARIDRELNVPGVISCNDNDRPCPMGRMCRDDLTCAP